MTILDVGCITEDLSADKVLSVFQINYKTGLSSDYQSQVISPIKIFLDHLDLFPPQSEERGKQIDQIQGRFASYGRYITRVFQRSSGETKSRLGRVTRGPLYDIAHLQSEVVDQITSIPIPGLIEELDTRIRDLQELFDTLCVTWDEEDRQAVLSCLDEIAMKFFPLPPGDQLTLLPKVQAAVDGAKESIQDKLS